MPDPIGRASARLFAAGVERRQRLQCLRFLGILLEIADEDGHVHCDPDDLGGLGLLHGMTLDEVNRSRALLETFDVLERVDAGWSIMDFAPVGEEVPPADVMEAIGRVLAKSVDAPAVTPAPVAPQAAVVPLEAAPTRRAQRWMAAPIGAAAAAAVVLVALLVSGQVRTPLTSQPASHSNERAVGAGATGTSTAPAGEPQTSSPQSPAPSTGSATAPSVAQPPAGVVPTSPAASGPPQVVCPVGGVTATVDRMDQRLDNSVPSRVNANLPPVWRTSVTGTVHNNSPLAVVANPFTVTVNFADPSGHTTESVTATALSAPTPIAAGASIPWSVSVDNPKDAPVPGTANATQPTWRWDDAKLAAACTP